MQQRKAYQRIALELPEQPPKLNNEPISRNASDGGDKSNVVANSTTSFVHQQQQVIAKKLGLFFWIAGLLNNAGYVIMIASAKSISEGGVGLVFLANILPALLIKASAPYWFEKVPYSVRLMVATGLMVTSFGIVALSSSLAWQLFGVACTSAQGSLGEASLLALAGKIDGELAALEEQTKIHHPCEDDDEIVQNHHKSSDGSNKSQKGVCLNGFSSGTGFAGVFGFFWVWFWNHTLGLSLSGTLLLAMVLAGGYLYSYNTISKLALQRDGIMATLVSRNGNEQQGYRDDNNNNDDDDDDDNDNDNSQDLVLGETSEIYSDHNKKGDIFRDKVDDSLDGFETNAIDPETTTPISVVREIASMSGSERFALVMSLWPYTVPLFTVYVAEYTLQSGTWTAIGFPVSDQESRDKFYQYSNWTYQMGVFLSRSSGACFVAPMALLWAMPVLQCANVALYWSIGAHEESFWHSPYFLYPTALYSGLLGGAVYIHGYLRICKDLPLQHREFALSATSLAECLGIVVADLLGLVIQACLYQIHGLDGAAMSCPK